VNPWHNVRLLHGGANALLALSLAAALAVGAWWLVHLPVFALRSVAIEAQEGAQLRFVSSPLLRQSVRRVSGSFFTVDLDAVRVAFESVPWVRRATVRRIWPNRLIVTLEEHRPFALWGDGRLINTYGELFAANLAEAEEDGPLPELSGPTGSQLSVANRYDELRRWLAALGRSPQAVSLSARHAWSARLDDGTLLLLGREQGLPIEARVARWVAAYPRVQARLDRPAEVVDLRYPNGFALRSVAVVAVDGEGGKAGGGPATPVGQKR